MRRAIFVMVICIGCGPSSEPEPEPEPVVVATGGDEAPPPEVSPRSFGGDATSWMASIREAAVNVMMGAEPPEDLPIDGAQGEAPWVQTRSGDPAPTNVEPIVAFFEGQVTLSDGNRAEVVVLFTPSGPRLARIDARSASGGAHPPMDPYLQPIADLASSMLADFRLGQGAQHIVTLDELRALSIRPDLIERIRDRLPDAEDVAAIEQVIQQPGVELAHIDADKVGVLMRDPTNGALYGVDLRFHAQSDGTYRFAGPPLLHVQRLPDSP